ncbi:hypothetical protein X291_01630 [Oenococcus oeni IOEB_C23]|uniref:hypothetical protein n=1 Tax=Oenococcus oeni TaxID=1247 RepID=UPI0005101170|nr:hypothetical protein [Oenococcus oeni]KGH67065.1 hypothetical protein X291_01630 [Oenococcus oeni IOEB_C23]
MKFLKHEKEIDQMATSHNPSYLKEIKDMRNTVKAVLDSENIPFNLYYLIVRRMDRKIENRE